MQSLYKNEVVLLHALRSGCADAVEYWFKQYRRPISQFVASKISSDKDVDELVQEIFINCLKHLPLFRGESGILTWMHGIARHEVADYYRKRYAKKAIKSLPLTDLLPSHQTHDAHEVAEKVKLVISQLKVEQRELLLLKYVDGKKVEEIAEELGRSIKAIESDLFRARKNFRELYVALE